MELNELTRHLLGRSGLYVLGAGASAGVISFGRELGRGIGAEYRAGGSYPVEIPDQDIRTNWAIASSLKSPFELSISNDELHNELVKRMPSGFVQRMLFYELAKPAFLNAVPYSYTVFEYFPLSTIINYNLDGLAEKFCSPRHRVISPHGTIDQKWGSPQFKEPLNKLKFEDCTDFL